MMKAGKGVNPESVGHVDAYAWPGGYPVICLVQTSNRFHCEEGVWCPNCANQAAWSISEDEDPDTLTLVAVDVHWEGEPLECEVCGEDIESAYGVPSGEEVES